jgi:hypothetical protein
VGPWRFALTVSAVLSTVGVFLVDASSLAGASPGVTSVVSGSARASSSTAVSGHSCNGVFHGNPPGSLVETTSAGPNDSTVSPGQTITVTLTWNSSDFGGNNPSKTDECVKIGGQIAPNLSAEHKPGPAGSTDTFRFVAPSGGTGGQPICVRTAVSGPNVNTEKSAVLCYTLLAVATPEVSMALLLPLAVLVVCGGAVLLARRRQQAGSHLH